MNLQKIMALAIADPELGIKSYDSAVPQEWLNKLIQLGLEKGFGLVWAYYEDGSSGPFDPFRWLMMENVQAIEDIVQFMNYAGKREPMPGQWKTAFEMVGDMTWPK